MKTVNVIKEDMDNCKSFGCILNCMVATAVKREWETENVRIGSSSASIDDVEYRMQNARIGGGNTALANAYNVKKNGGEFVPFVVTFTTEENNSAK